MAHYSRLSKIVIDVPAEAHDAEVAFWQDALGAPLRRFRGFPEFHGAELSADGIGLVTQQIGAGPVRIHLDFHTTDRTAEVARLERLGATVVQAGEHWTVMRDPAGLAFCVIPDPDVNESNATAWPD